MSNGKQIIEIQIAYKRVTCNNDGLTENKLHHSTSCSSLPGEHVRRVSSIFGQKPNHMVGFGFNPMMADSLWYLHVLLFLFEVNLPFVAATHRSFIVCWCEVPPFKSAPWLIVMHVPLFYPLKLPQVNTHIFRCWSVAVDHSPSYDWTFPLLSLRD